MMVDSSRLFPNFGYIPKLEITRNYAKEQIPVNETCGESDKLSGVRQHFSSWTNVRIQTKCQESDKISGFGQNVRIWTK